jgi:hypothetical protein
MLIMQHTDSINHSEWTFDYAGVRWTWTMTLLDGRKICSEASFETRTECVGDAAKHGYTSY